jgi:hypothetical protein
MVVLFDVWLLLMSLVFIPGQAQESEDRGKRSKSPEVSPSCTDLQPHTCIQFFPAAVPPLCVMY